jgi:hypothetical protein
MSRSGKNRRDGRVFRFDFIGQFNFLGGVIRHCNAPAGFAGD